MEVSTYRPLSDWTSGKSGSGHGLGKGVITIDPMSYLLGGLVLFGFTVNGLLKRFERPSRKFPTCRICGKPMLKVSLPKRLPDEVLGYLDELRLPASIVSRYICPKGDYQLWFIPKLGNTERAFFLREPL